MNFQRWGARGSKLMLMMGKPSLRKRPWSRGVTMEDDQGGQDTGITKHESPKRNSAWPVEVQEEAEHLELGEKEQRWEQDPVVRLERKE